MKLASRKSYGKYVSLAEEFDVIIEDNVVYHFFSLYKKKVHKIGIPSSCYCLIPLFLHEAFK